MSWKSCLNAVTCSVEVGESTNKKSHPIISAKMSRLVIFLHHTINGPLVELHVDTAWQSAFLNSDLVVLRARQLASSGCWYARPGQRRNLGQSIFLRSFENPLVSLCEVSRRHRHHSLVLNPATRRIRDHRLLQDPWRRPCASCNVHFVLRPGPGRGRPGSQAPALRESHGRSRRKDERNSQNSCSRCCPSACFCRVSRTGCGTMERNLDWEVGRDIPNCAIRTNAHCERFGTTGVPPIACESSSESGHEYNRRSQSADYWLATKYASADDHVRRVSACVRRSMVEVRKS